MPLINFSGIASGIDTNGLIDATSAATRKARVTPNQTKVSDLTETNTAFDTLSTKLESLRSNLKPFSTLAGGGVSKAATSSKESVVSATASNAAANGSYSVEVVALAKNHVGSFDGLFADPADPVQVPLNPGDPAVDRTVSFAIGIGANLTTVDIVIPSDTYSAQDFVNAFNTATTKASASLVNVGTASSTQYKIVITSNNEGLDKGQVITTVGTALTDLTYSQSQATDAEIKITGIASGASSILRSTNSIADVIPGLTLNLASIGTATVKVSEDAATTTSKVQTFIDSYNDIVQFIAENDTITRDESDKDVKNIFGPLASSRTDDGALSALRSLVASTFASGGSTVRIFSDLGITTQRDGTLALDSTKLQTAISGEPSSVSSILQSFADTSSGTGGTIDVYTRFNGLIDISTNSNKTLITDLNNQITEVERQITRTEDEMRARFARLESTIGRLQQQQSSLNSALAGLG